LLADMVADAEVLLQNFRITLRVGKPAGLVLPGDA